MDCFTAQQTTELVSRIGCKKATMRLDKLFINSFMAGPLLGFGCAVLLSTNAAPWYQTNAPGFIRTIGALIFPIGLVMITLTGADLFTTNVMFMFTAFLHRRITIFDLLKNWLVSFFGNLAGSLFIMAIITGYGGVFTEPAYVMEVHSFAIQKVVDPAWHQIMLRGIGANWLVCLAVFLSISARELVSKITAIWMPTTTFVALALDHVVANMYFIPTAIMYSTPGISVKYYIWKSMIPTLIGNIIGGGLGVALPYWYLYLHGNDVVVQFGLSASGSAVGEQGGPVRSEQKKRTRVGGEVINGVSIDDTHLPSSSGHMQSVLSTELSEEKYAKPLAERRAEESANSSETV